MRVTFEDTLSRKEWLHKELLDSLTEEVINKAREDQYYEVKLLVNGVELEPEFYNDLVNNITDHIEAQAKSMVVEKLNLAEEEAEKLYQLVKETKENIINKFGLESNW